MNVSAVGASGMMTVSSAAESTPHSVMEPSQTGQASGGDASVSPSELQQIVSDMQGQLDSMNVSLQYSVYGDNDNKVAVKVVNKDTGEVIREIPAKEMQALQTKMSELVGMIFASEV
jgi:flagellar protein FlaG